MAYLNKIVVTMAVLAIVVIVCQASSESNFLKPRQKRDDSCATGFTDAVQGAANGLVGKNLPKDLLASVVVLVNAILNLLKCLLPGISGACATAISAVIILLTGAVTLINGILAIVGTAVCVALS